MTIGLVSLALAGCGASPNSTPSTVTVTSESSSAVAAPTSTVAPVTDVTLPDVVGQNGEIAQDKLEDLGLTDVGFASGNPNYSTVLLVRNWTVVAMEPASGTVVKSDDPVILTVYKD